MTNSGYLTGLMIADLKYQLQYHTEALLRLGQEFVHPMTSSSRKENIKILIAWHMDDRSTSLNVLLRERSK